MKINIDSYMGNFQFETEINQVESFDYMIKGLQEQTWEFDTFYIIHKYSDPKKTFLDIGAWIGPMSMYASNLYGEVISVEPDKKAHSCLVHNLAPYRNVSKVNKAVASLEKEKKLFLGINSNCPRSSPGDSKNQVRNKKSLEGDYEVDTVKVSELFSMSNNSVALVKVDIEGYEEKIIPDLFNSCFLNKVDLWLSFHFNWWENKDLERFADYFNRAKSLHVLGENGWYKFENSRDMPSNVIPFTLQGNPFCTILFQF